MRFSIRKSISSHSLFHNYLFAFLLGFGALLIVYLPAMCLEHGYFLYSFHSRCILADTEMGGCGERTSQRPLAYPHRLPHGT